MIFQLYLRKNSTAMNENKDKTIVFMDFPTQGEASIVKGALESNNIPCFLSNENNPFVGNNLSEYGVRLHIFEKDKEKAEELMELINSVTEDDDSWEDESLEETREL